MSLPLESSASAGAVESAATTESEEGLVTFSLTVKSPSSAPLNFSQLQARTTVKELKAKIRDSLPAIRPADDRQRLIYQGRLLAQDHQSMLSVFGQEALSNPESRILHLAIRPNVAPESPPTMLVPLQGPVFTPLEAQQPRQDADVSQTHATRFDHDEQDRMMERMLQHGGRATRFHDELNTLNPEQANHVPLQQPTQDPNLSRRASTQQEDLSHLPDYVLNLMRIERQNLERVNQLVQEQQESRRHNPPHTGPELPRFVQDHITQQRAHTHHRPGHSHTEYREGVGPEGEGWQVSVQTTTTSFPAAQLTAHRQGQANSQAHSQVPLNQVRDMQNILRGADRLAIGQNPQLNGQQASATSHIGDSATAAIAESTLDPNIFGSSPIALSASPPPAASAATPSSNPSRQSSDPMVYILSSPTGPRALLMHNAETFFTPRSSNPLATRLTGLQIPQAGAERGVFAGLPEFRNRAPRRVAHRGAHHPPNAQPVAQPQENAGHPANPGAAAMAMRIWPTLWLVVRLMIFIWFFTAGNPHWSRFFLISAVAVIVFIVNTGALNRMADSLWTPIRRHIETMLPLADPEAALVPAANAVIRQTPPAGAPNTNRRGELDPAEVAAHLLEQRRRQPHWIATQFRRAEHAMFLFIATLVPGVGERHIAAREAQAVAAETERQRLIDAETAAQAAEDGDGQQVGAVPRVGGDRDQGQNAGGEAAPARAGHVPLIDV